MAMDRSHQATDIPVILRIQRLGANSVELDEVAHYEPPHQDLLCFQIQRF